MGSFICLSNVHSSFTILQIMIIHTYHYGLYTFVALVEIQISLWHVSFDTVKHLMQDAGLGSRTSMRYP